MLTYNDWYAVQATATTQCAALQSTLDSIPSFCAAVTFVAFSLGMTITMTSLATRERESSLRPISKST